VAMSWASTTADAIMKLYLETDEMSVDYAVERAIRETIEECARRCETKAQELADLGLGDAAMRTTWHEAAAAVRAMLEDAP